MKPIRTLLIPCLLLISISGLTGCDQVMEVLNKQKANGKAIGAACRHSGRALEDCYRRNPRIAKADIFAGWKEMNEYMLAKKLDVVPPPPDLPATSAIPKAAANIAAPTEEGEGGDTAEKDHASAPAHAKTE
ncbi:hypothetical protein SAMN02745857_01267 [Andreprevotia lacus DSM 23236]|jgi:hypothetical protein|uniref:Conjugative transfer region protein TrbK n=1 Tax=Andreprevotia lacus DSM 23236 TaxID=1121001 RepID=A0A1W1XDJ9_9NEIS|nr:hypothetical protein [Andreprevotia lacus]SMC21874.1 hypothetical protein SAMN02745857_01267 [Andreprevotia lacus DSM 23236]